MAWGGGVMDVLGVTVTACSDSVRVTGEGAAQAAVSCPRRPHIFANSNGGGGASGRSVPSALQHPGIAKVQKSHRGSFSSHGLSSCSKAPQPPVQGWARTLGTSSPSKLLWSNLAFQGVFRAGLSGVEQSVPAEGRKEGKGNGGGGRASGGQASFPAPQRQRGAQGNPVGALPNCPGVCSPMWDRGSWPSPSPPSRNCPYWCSLPPPLPPPPAALFWTVPPASLPSILGCVSQGGSPPRCPSPFYTWREVSTWSSRGWKLPWVGVGQASSLLVLAEGAAGRERRGRSETKVLPPERHPAVGHILVLLRWSGALGQPQEETRIPLPERLLAGPTWPLLLG